MITGSYIIIYEKMYIYCRLLITPLVICSNISFQCSEPEFESRVAISVCINIHTLKHFETRRSRARFSSLHDLAMNVFERLQIRASLFEVLFFGTLSLSLNFAHDSNDDFRSGYMQKKNYYTFFTPSDDT